MRTLIAGAACAAALLSVTCAQAQSAADARFKALYTREWNWRDGAVRREPEGQAPVMDHLPKVDAETQAMRLAYWQEVMSGAGCHPAATALARRTRSITTSTSRRSRR